MENNENNIHQRRTKLYVFLNLNVLFLKHFKYIILLLPFLVIEKIKNASKVLLLFFINFQKRFVCMFVVYFHQIFNNKKLLVEQRCRNVI